MSSLAQAVFTRLSPRAFAAFTFEILNSDYGDLIEKSSIGPGVFRRLLPMSEGWMGHRPYEGVYVNHFMPSELFTGKAPLIDAEAVGDVLDRIRAYYAHEPPIIEEGGADDIARISPLAALYLLINTAGLGLDETRKTLVPQWHSIVESAGFDSLKSVMVGSFDTFAATFDMANLERVLANVITSEKEGLCITVFPDATRVRPFAFEKPVFAGVAQTLLTPCETAYLPAQYEHRPLVEEFESLLRPETKEGALESFLAAHYRDIFGPEYDRIEAQLWLRFPELDITGHERRLDLFLRNSVQGDWELFELKRAVPITTIDRHLPVFSSQLHHAVEQVRNYSRILKQHAVKERLAREGIEYFEPELNIVIGRTPQLDTAQWRRLLKNNSQDVKILTYDRLLSELRLRLDDREQLLRSRGGHSRSLGE